MQQILRKIVKFLAYAGAGVVILLAIAVGLFRLFLPRLPEYQEEIKNWASAAIGMQVEFSGMDARWGLSGPELEFYDAELIRPDSETRVLAADEVRVGVGLVRLLSDRTLVVDRVVVGTSSIEVRQLEDGSFRMQGSRIEDLLALRADTDTQPASMDLIGEQIEVSFMRPGDERPTFFQIPRLQISVDDRRIAADAEIVLPESLGSELGIAATQLLGLPQSQRSWDVSVEADDVQLAGWTELAALQRGFAGGVGDIDLALIVNGRSISQATAQIDLLGVALDANRPFDMTGRIEADLAEDGWLIAADEFVVRRGEREWPESRLRLETSTDTNGNILLLDARASFVELRDVELFEPWLPDAQRARVAALGLSGSVRDVSVTISDLQSDEPRYNVDASLDSVGIAAMPGQPGVRGFSGNLHASHSGGSLGINASTLEIDAPEIVPNVLALDAADSMIFWRRRADELSIWSDGLQLSNNFFSSYSDVDLVFAAGSERPTISLSSNWSISDIGAARRYIPPSIMQPKLYDWFQMALRSGSIARATTELNGPLDRFPFDGGEGQLLINASVRNLDFKYHPDWPASRQADLEVVLDNARLYSNKNSSVTLGNRAVDAKVEIADLRDPVLRIESFATGTLESIREYALQSPIVRVFGEDNLQRVSVSGDASFTLDLLIPLKRERLQEFEFVSRIRSNNGTMQVAGFDVPITDLIGDVTLSRDMITSESLGGTFLGRPLSIVLSRSEDPQYSVIADTAGTLTESGIVDGLGVPIAGMVSGETPFVARVLFPSRRTEEPPPLTIQLESDLQGLAVNLPSPIGKSDEQPLNLRGDIRFLPGGEVIASSGVVGDDLAWNLAFEKPEGFWDLDRGVVMFGDEPMQNAETRGLHLRGNTGEVSLAEWLAISRSGEKNVGAADRIRSIDVVIDEFLVLGQRLQAHRVRVDRSARDWLVQIDGGSIAGSIFVPYEFGGERAMVLDMTRMRLPGDDEAAPDEEAGRVDPRNLPPIELRAAEFAFGERNLGEVEAALARIPQGLEATLIRATDNTFDVVGNGRWVADANDPLGSRSYVTATLNSRDVEETLRRLSYQPGIAGDSMSILLNVEWSGSPRADFFDTLDGEVQVRLSDGQLEEVEPGAGRMFGLMSIAALPRRLSLDFRDVFSKGFGFDSIAGKFQIVGGKTYTCDLALEGPAANVGIVGEANIVDRSYNQTAVVSANVGNTLPIVGAVVAGPQAAAALLIFSQIFKKPLEEAGQVYYAIDGSWDEPSVESTDAEAFIASSELAGCLENPE